MQIYVIPFILLLVIALLLKIRESKKNADQPQHKRQKDSKRVKSKKTKHSKTTSSKVEPALTPTSLPKIAVSDVNSAAVEKIQHLIHQEKFQHAEAKINLALNQNPDQHALYLLLVDIYLKENNDLAHQQLVKQLDQLQLHTTKVEVENKIKAFHAAQELEKFKQVAQSKLEQQPVQTSQETEKSPEFTPKVELSDTHQKRSEVQEHSNTPIDFTSDSNLNTNEQQTIQSPAEIPSSSESLNSTSNTIEFDTGLEMPNVTAISLDASLQNESIPPLETSTAPVDDHTFELDHIEFDLESPSSLTQHVPHETPSEHLDFSDAKLNLNNALITDTAIFESDSLSTVPDSAVIDLDLKLAELYFQLNASDAALELLELHHAHFSNEQLHKSEDLKNLYAKK